MTEQSSLAAALAALQAQLPHVTKDAANDHFKSRYASLQAISAALLPVMAGLGLSFTCRPTLSDGQLVLAYSLTHSPTGEHMDGIYPLGTGTPQQVGSAITYARRYALCAVTGLAADDDDDGNAASSPAPRASRQTAASTADPARGKTPTEQRATRARRAADSAGPRNPDAPRSTALGRAAEQERVIAQTTGLGHGGGQRTSAPLPDDDNAWQDATPEDRPGSIGTGQRKGLEALLGQFYGLASTDRDGRHLAVQQLLSLDSAPASVLDLSYNQAKHARDKIVTMMAAREREARLAAAGAPDHAQRAANDNPWSSHEPWA